MMLMMTKIIWIAPLFKWLISRRMDLHTTHCIGRKAITGRRYNQPQSFVPASYTVWACNSLFITHLPLCLQKDRDPGRNSKPQIATLRSNKAVAVLPWKPWRNLEPSGSSSGVYSLYPPTKSWLKTLRPTRGPGDDPVLLRWPSTWNTRSRNVNIQDGSLSVREHTFYNNLLTLQ